MFRKNISIILSGLIFLIISSGLAYVVYYKYPQTTLVTFILFEIVSIIVLLATLGLLDWLNKDNITTLEETEKDLSPTVTGKNISFQDDWLLEKQEQIVDLKEGGRIAECETIVNLKSKKQNNKTFYFTSSPNDGVDLKITQGKLSSINKANEAFSEVLLEKEVNAGDPLDIKITFRLNDTFLSNKEWWLHRKIYDGGSYNLKIIFPADRPLKGFACSVYKGEFLKDPQQLEKAPVYSFKDGRSELIVNCKMNVNNRLLVEWDW